MSDDSDVGFKVFITPSLLVATWWLIVVATLIAYGAFLIQLSQQAQAQPWGPPGFHQAARQPDVPAPVQIIIATVIAAGVLLISRIQLECIAIFFRIETHQRTMKTTFARMEKMSKLG